MHGPLLVRDRPDQAIRIDRVLFIEGEREVEDGAPSELRKRSGRHGSLHRQWAESLA